MADCKSQLREYDSIRLELVSKEEDDVFVEADKTRIGQVISNLLNNAIKFTQEEKGEEESAISVTLEEHENDDENNKSL
jgi:signal transduction histidine kinase